MVGAAAARECGDRVPIPALVRAGEQSPATIDSMTTARYDGVADWYDLHLAPGPEMRGIVEDFVGPGTGTCLDLCCGTGFHLESLLGLGWAVTGVDISSDQLRLARRRVGRRVELLEADAADLPFADASFDLVFSAFAHTDVDDFSAVVGEIARVLRAPGCFVFFGPHPCFVGPHSEFVEAKGVPTLHAGYRRPGRYSGGPGISPTGLRAKVGAVHLPLGDLLQTVIDAGFVLDRFAEPVTRNREYPHWLAFRARR